MSKDKFDVLWEALRPHGQKWRGGHWNKRNRLRILSQVMMIRCGMKSRHARSRELDRCSVAQLPSRDSHEFIVCRAWTSGAWFHLIKMPTFQSENAGHAMGYACKQPPANCMLLCGHDEWPKTAIGMVRDLQRREETFPDLQGQRQEQWCLWTPPKVGIWLSDVIIAQ